MTDLVFEFSYFWAILLLFVMERVCSLQDQFDKDISLLPDLQQTDDLWDPEDFDKTDYYVKLAFLRLFRLMHVTMLLSLVYFCNISLWYMMNNKASPRTLRYKFKVTVP